MGAVVVKVEVEFTASTWTDISADVRMTSAMSITGGRSDTDERVQPGRLTGLVLWNTDGHYTVGNTAGDYYPNVRSGKRVRVSVKDPGGATYYTRFTGYVDGWPMRWDAGNCYVTVSATDALGQLLPPIDPDLWLRYSFDDAGAQFYWPMTDDWQDGAHREALSGGPALLPTGSPPPPTDTGPPGVISALPQTSSGRYWSRGGMPVDDSGTGLYGPRWKAGVLFKSSSAPDSTTEILTVGRADGSYRAAARITTDGELQLSRYSSSTWTDSASGSPKDVCDGRWWYIGVVGYEYDSSNTLTATAYRCDDGTYSGPAAPGVTAAQALVDQTELTLTVGGGAYTATVGHAGWNPDGLGSYSGFLGLDLYDTFMGLPDQDLTAAEWGTVFDSLSPFDVTCTVPTGRGSELYRRTFTGTWLDLWRHCEDVDGGVTYAERDGTVVYLSGAHRTTPQDGTNAVIAVDLTAATITSLEVAADRLKMVNDATVTLNRVGEAGDQIMAELQIVDDASVTASGRRAKTLNAYGTRTSGPVDIAADLLSPTEVPRIPQVAVDAFTLPTATQQDILFGNYDGSPVGMWSLIGVTDLPDTGGFPSQWLGRVEGWSETISTTQWRIVFNTSFAGNRVGDSTWAKVGTMRLG